MAKHAMNTKELMVGEISNRLNKAETIIVTNYKGLTAQNLNQLRRELRNIKGEYVVIKDSMAKRALVDSENSKISEFIVGEVGIAIDNKPDATYISKILVKFAKDHEFLKISGGLMSGSFLSKDDIKTLAALPGREVLLGILANVLNAPIQGLAGALNAIICKVLYALNAVKDKKEGAKSENKAA